MGTTPRRKSPFVGLVPFDEDDHYLFFGRENDTARVVANLSGPHLVVLYGPSGVGKSSLLNAGVMHDLNERSSTVGAVYRDWSRPNRLRQIADEVEAAVETRLREETEASMAGGGRGAAGTSETGLDDDRPEAAEELDSEDLHGRLVAAARQADTQVMLLLDQFEDYFLYVADSDVDTNRRLAAALSSTTENLHVLVSIREDSLALLDRFRGLVPGLLNNYLRLDPLDRPSTSEAITKPLEFFRDLQGRKYEIEDQLVDVILDDLEGETARQLSSSRKLGQESGEQYDAALVQLVMERLWEEAHNSGHRTLRLSTYNNLNLETIVRDYVDRVMRPLLLDDRRACIKIFSELVTTSGDRIAHRLRHLAAEAYRDDDEVRRLLNTLAKERIVRLVDREAEVYEICHDVLALAIRGWVHDYEREMDPSAQVRHSLVRRFNRAAEMAKTGSREEQLAATRTFLELGKSQVDPSLSDRALEALRRLSRSTGARPFVDVGQRREVPNAASAAVAVLEVDRLRVAVLANLAEISSSMESGVDEEFEREQIDRNLSELERLCGEIEGLDSDNMGIAQEAFSAILDLDFSVEQTMWGFEARSDDLATESQARLHLIAKRLQKCLEQYEPSESSSDALAWLSDEAEPASVTTRLHRWSAAVLTGLLSVAAALLILGGSEWLTNAWLGDWGRTSIPGTVWVLGTFGLLVAAFAAFAAYDLEESSVLASTGWAVWGSISVLLIVGLLWVAAGLMGLMVHTTFDVSLTWSTYVSVVAIPAVTGGLIGLTTWLLDL